LPGYEWSGNTGVGGDRNVYFRTEGRTIRRSSHALIKDREEIHTDAPTARALFAALQDEDCVVYAHIGGRPADVAYAHDPRLETAMEIHSAWGTFEWLMADCFEQGYRVAVVADACASPQQGHDYGLQRMRDAGVTVTSAKGLFFEWVRDVERCHDFFRNSGIGVPEGLYIG